MEIILKKLKEQKGDFNLLAVVLLLFCVMVLIVTMNISAIYINLQTIDAEIQAATLAVASDNAHNIWGGFREGNSAERKMSDSWINTLYISPSDVAAELCRTYGCTASGSFITRTNSKGIMYQISIDKVEHTDIDVCDNGTAVVKIYTTATVRLPILIFKIGIPITRTKMLSSEFSPYY